MDLRPTTYQIGSKKGADMDREIEARFELIEAAIQALTINREVVDSVDPPGSIKPMETDFLGVLRYMQGTYSHVGVGLQAALVAISAGVSALSASDCLSRIITNFLTPAEPGAADDLHWEQFFEEATSRGAQYEAEVDREHPLTFAEMLRCLAHSAREYLRNDAFAIKSPTGDPNCATLGHIITEIIGDLNQVASHLGCRRGPEIPWSTGGKMPGGVSLPGR
ncbi:hypothetical protein N9X87_00070 [bacterium]|nr:hypothetical protein [bacterium]